MSEDSRFVIISCTDGKHYGVLDNRTQQVAASRSLITAHTVLQKCLDGNAHCVWWSSLAILRNLYGNWSVMPTQTPVYAVNVDLPELATNLTVDMDKYIT